MNGSSKFCRSMLAPDLSMNGKNKSAGLKTSCFRAMPYQAIAKMALRRVSLGLCAAKFQAAKNRLFAVAPQRSAPEALSLGVAPKVSKNSWARKKIAAPLVPVYT